MTDPVQALAYSPYQENPDTVPTWRKAAFQANLAQQKAQVTANSPYSATNQTNQLGALSASQQAMAQSDVNQTQSTQQAAATNQGYQQQYQQNVFNYNDQKAQAATAAANAQAMKDLQTKYNTLANQQQQWFTGQQSAINNTPNGSSTYTPPGNGTSGSNVPIQYSGQASQVAQMARNAGFPESAVATAVAISQAESSGRADAVNNANRNGTSDYGLMQINSVHSDLLNKYNWKDPQQNMDMAYQIYKSAGGSFTPWSTYNSGVYQNYMTMGRQASSAVIPASGPVPVQSQTTSGLRQTIINKAETYIGLPYVWGGTDLSKGVDCSGLVQQVYKQFGLNLPRVSASQYTGHLGSTTYGVRTNVSQLEPGDLVFFKHSDGQVHHVAIWLGKGQILEAPHTGADVRIRTLSKSDVPYGLHLYGLDSAGTKATGKNNPVAI
jgi:cell wall-associated NlpC family hydrolase